MHMMCYITHVGKCCCAVCQAYGFPASLLEYDADKFLTRGERAENEPLAPTIGVRKIYLHYVVMLGVGYITIFQGETRG